MRGSHTFSFALAALASAQEPPPTEPRAANENIFLKTAERAVDWIGRQAVPIEGHEDAVLFPGTAELKRQREAVVYNGTAGVLVFLENAAKVLGSDLARSLADRAAAGLLATAREGEHGRTWVKAGMREGAASLYCGDAGVGHAFLVRARLRADQDALKVATAVGDSLIARGERDGDTLAWDRQVEIIYGAAGTALFLLELAEATGETRFRDAAQGVGRWLISESELQETAPPRRLWRWQLGGNAPYVGFSHGTAGVAYALLRIGSDSKDEACIAAAKDGAQWLAAQSIRDGELLRWPPVAVEGREGRSMGGWCHGAPGTARLLLLLHAVTKESDYLDDAMRSARWVMAQAGPADAKEPPQFPPSFCCGVAGVIDFFCDLHRATGNEEYAAFAVRAGSYLVDMAKVDGEGVKWANGQNAHGSSTERHNTDLMLGAAGEAFALLRLATLRQRDDPMVGMPDRRVVRK